MKRFISFVIVFVMVFMVFSYIPSQTINKVIAADTSYKSWRQGDSEWSWKSLGNTCNMGSDGCLITSIAMLMVHSGAEPNNRSVFNPGILRDRYVNGGHITYSYNKEDDGNLVVSTAHSQLNSPNFYIFQERKNEFHTDSFNTIYAKVSNYLNNGYYVVVSVNYNGHWVAVDYCSAGEIYIMDPAGKTNRLKQYDGSIESVKIFCANNINNPTIITPSKPTLAISSGTSTSKTTFSWNACSDANRYDVRIYHSGESEPFIYQETTDTSLTYDLPEGSYYATVASVNTDHVTWTFSDAVEFTVNLGICEPKAVTSYNGHVYALYNNLTYYDQARQLCNNMGGHLATITSQAENDAVASLMGSASINEYWIGGTREGSSWKWDTNEPYSYEHWSSGEPNNVDNVENYIVMNKSGYWNDERSSGTMYFGFILEIDSLDISATEEYNGHIYYRFDKGLNWTEANEYSKMLGGNLAVITSEEENEFVHNLIKDGSKDLY